jgi:hypothetical protein
MTRDAANPAANPGGVQAWRGTASRARYKWML